MQNEGVHFPIEDFYKNEPTNASITPNLPLDLEGFDTQAFKSEPGQAFVPNPHSIDMPEPLSVGKPGFFASFGHALLEQNELVNAGKFIANGVMDMHHLSDPVPDNYQSQTFEAVNGFDQKYWPYLLGNVSPKDLQARQERVRDQMKDDDYYSKGSLMGQVLGGIGGFMTSPSSYLIPMSAGIKYATFGQNLVRNTIQAAPAMAASTIVSEGMVQAGRAGGNLQEMAVNSLRDMVYGTALAGIGLGIGHGLDAGHLWNLRKNVNANHAGVDINPVINEKGQLRGYEATAAPGMAANAKQVELAQEFVDSSMQRSGLLKLPYMDKVLGNKFLGSPIVRGLTSDFQTIRQYTDRMASHGIITEGTAKGIPRAPTAEDLLQFTRAKTTVFNHALRGKFFEANGLEGGLTAKNAVKNFKQTLSKEQTVTWDEFGKSIRDVIYTENQHENAHVNDASKMVMDFIKEIGDEFRDAHGWEEDWLPPRTAVNYLMQNYNIDAITKNPEKFIDVVSNAYRIQDETISRLNGPVLEAKARFQGLQEAMKNPIFVETRAIANELAEARGRINYERDKLVKELRDNPDHHILLDDRVLLDSAEAAQLKSHLTPLRDTEAEQSKMRGILTELKAEKSRIQQRLTRNKKDETRKANLKALDDVNKKIEFQDSTIKGLDDKIFEENDKLHQAIGEGKIDRKFYIRDRENAKIIWRDPDELPKLRRVFESHDDRQMAARDLAEKIKGNTAMQLNQSILGRMFPGHVENPSYLKERSVMIPSKVFNDAGFLDTNLDRAIASYSNTMGRYTALRRTFNDHDLGIDGMIRALSQEHGIKQATILKQPESPERGKELIKLQRKFQDAQEHMKLFHDAFMGKSSMSPKARRRIQAVKNYTAIARLGGVPIAQLTDLGGIVLKRTLYPFMAQGLKPMLSSLNGKLNTREAQAVRENAAHAYVAVQHLHSGYSEKWMNYDSTSDVPVGGRIASALDNIAHLSGNFYGTNYIENLNQRMVANMFQSEVMKAMFDYKKGTITEKQLTKMASVGIDVKNMSDRFIKNFKNSDGWEEFGGYQSAYYNWADADAVDHMARGIHRAVYDTVVQRGMFSSPLWTNNPIAGMIFTFHGWAYSALTRYTIPAMQRPDAETAMGLSVMFGLGMLSEPLRQLANGKEVDLNDEHMFWHAFSNSGIAGPAPDLLINFNAAFNMNLIPWMQNEKLRNLSVLGVLGGPVGGVAQDAASLLGHMWKGDITQNDAKKGLRLMGATNHLAIRGLLNKMVENSSLPESRKDAEPNRYWQALSGTESQ